MHLPHWSRRRWLILHGVHLSLWAAVGVAFALGAFTGSHYRTVFGVKLDQAGQQVYAKVQANSEQNGRLGTETLPASEAAKLTARNNEVPTVAPFTDATPEPATITDLVRNHSARSAGAKPLLWVVHDTESPNVQGLQDVYAIVAWFNNPASQASANYVTDAEGNTALMVPTSEKSWEVAWFNSWSIGDELIGYASQTSWPDAQLRAAAQLAAHDLVRYGIPVQHGAVSGCTITRPGILMHANLGQCGGGHHDAGPHFPMARFISMVRQYVNAIKHPVVKPKPSKPAWFIAAKKLAPMWAWISWRDHGHPAKLRPAQIPKRVPQAWWARYAVHAGARG